MRDQHTTPIQPPPWASSLRTPNPYQPEHQPDQPEHRASPAKACPSRNLSFDNVPAPEPMDDLPEFGQQAAAPLKIPRRVGRPRTDETAQPQTAPPLQSLQDYQASKRVPLKARVINTNLARSPSPLTSPSLAPTPSPAPSASSDRPGARRTTFVVIETTIEPQATIAENFSPDILQRLGAFTRWLRHQFDYGGKHTASRSFFDMSLTKTFFVNEEGRLCIVLQQLNGRTQAAWTSILHSGSGTILTLHFNEDRVEQDRNHKLRTYLKDHWGVRTETYEFHKHWVSLFA